MAWVLIAGLAGAVVVAALVVLALVMLSLWRRTKALMRQVAAAGESVAASTEALAQQQAATPSAHGRPRMDTSPSPARRR